MSICYQNNQPTWFYDRNEICCKIPVEQLTRLLDNKIAFDPRAIICAFKNGNELDREAIERLKACVNQPASLFASLRGWASGLKKEEASGASVLIINSGEIRFPPYMVGGLMTKDHTPVSCELSIAAKIVDLEKFVLNALEESNTLRNAVSHDTLLAREEDHQRIRELEAQIDILNVKIVEETKKLGLLGRLNFSGNGLAAKRAISQAQAKVSRLETEIRDIRTRAANTYEKEFYNIEQNSLDYFVYYSNDLYASVLGRNIEDLLRQILKEFTVDELLSNESLASPLEKLISGTEKIASRFAEIGISVRVDTARVMDLHNGAITEEVLKERANIDAIKWKVRFAEGDYEWKLREREADNAERRLGSDKELDKLAEDNYLNKGKGSLVADAAEDNLKISARILQTAVDMKSIELDNDTRLKSIENLQNKMQIKSDFDAKWFVQELERQDIIKKNELEKLHISMGWEREDDALARERDKKEINRQEQMRDWDFENAEVKNNQLKQALQDALEIEKAKAKVALENVDFDADIDRKSRTKDAEISIDKKDYDYGFYKKEREDRYEFDRRFRDEKFNLDIEERKDEADFRKQTRYDDWKTERLEREKRLDVELEERRRLANEDSAERAFNRDMKSRDQQIAMLDRLNEAERLRREDARRLNQDNNDKDVELGRQRSQVDLAKVEAETAYRTSEDYKARAKAEAEQAAQKMAYEMMMQQMREDRERDYRERRQEREDQKEAERIASDRKYAAEREAMTNAHRENMAKISDDRMRSERDSEVEYYSMKEKNAHEERMAEINSEARVANARCEEKEISIGRIADSSQKESSNSRMYCEKCQRYFPSEFAMCPLCGNKLKGVII